MNFLKLLLYPQRPGFLNSIGMLAVRLVMGAAFIMHGWPKIQNPMGWMPAAAGVPGFLQAAAAIAEFGGGILLIPGLLTTFVSLLLVVTMSVAVFGVHVSAGHPFVSKEPPSYELGLVYLVVAVLFMLTGPGMLSLDRPLFGGKSKK